MEETFEQTLNKNIIHFIWRKRKLIGITTIIGAIASLIISFFITPLYLSTAIVFPTATNNVSFTEQRNSDFGEEAAAEKLVQILQSAKIQQRIVGEFELMKHYGINPNDPYKNHLLGLAYTSHITFTRTRFGSIQIDVLDKDPKLAAAIANKIVVLIDTVKNEILKERNLPAFLINKRKMDFIKLELKTVMETLDSLSSIGVVTSDGRAQLFQAYSEAKGKEDKKFFKDKIEVNSKFGARFDGLALLRDEKISKIAQFETAYEQAESDANTTFNHKFVVEKAVVSDRKEKPKKAIIVIVSSLAVLLFSIIVLMIQEKIKQLRKEEE